MYRPAHFVETDPAALLALARTAPLATLVRTGPGGLAADAIPLEVDVAADGTWCLRGHVARANPLWREADGTEVLAIFHGPQGYVSPAWYPAKAALGKVVPTWNYAVVHAHGRLRAIDDAGWLRAFVGRLTDRHEAGRAAPWAIADAPADYVDAMLRAIVGIEIAVTRLEGKAKLSQNRDAADRAGVVAGLEAEAGPAAGALADAVRDA